MMIESCSLAYLLDFQGYEIAFVCVITSCHGYNRAWFVISGHGFLWLLCSVIV